MFASNYAQYLLNSIKILMKSWPISLLFVSFKDDNGEINFGNENFNSRSFLPTTQASKVPWKNNHQVDSEPSLIKALAFLSDEVEQAWFLASHEAFLLFYLEFVLIFLSRNYNNALPTIFKSRGQNTARWSMVLMSGFGKRMMKGECFVCDTKELWFLFMVIFFGETFLMEDGDGRSKRGSRREGE